jgi:N-sulfoglucosamine sulfohydrolase
MFLSDHGMPLPFAKTNCWHHSTHTPWIVRWPGKVEAGSHDRKHVVSGVDLTPTVLDALGLPALDGADGRSFLPVLGGEEQEGRDFAFAHINTIASKKAYTMRAVIGRDYRYIWNGWHDGKKTFRNESLSGLSWKAMTKAAEIKSEIAERVDFYSKRVPEELYHAGKDPDSLRNLIKEPGQEARVAHLQSLLRKHMKDTVDPQFEKLP